MLPRGTRSEKSDTATWAPKLLRTPSSSRASSLEVMRKTGVALGGSTGPAHAKLTGEDGGPVAVSEEAQSSSERALRQLASRDPFERGPPRRLTLVATKIEIESFSTRLRIVSSSRQRQLDRRPRRSPSSSSSRPHSGTRRPGRKEPAPANGSRSQRRRCSRPGATTPCGSPTSPPPPVSPTGSSTRTFKDKKEASLIALSAFLREFVDHFAPPEAVGAPSTRSARRTGAGLPSAGPTPVSCAACSSWATTTATSPLWSSRNTRETYLRVARNMLISDGTEPGTHLLAVYLMGSMMDELVRKLIVFPDPEFLGLLPPGPPMRRSPTQPA